MGDVIWTVTEPYTVGTSVPCDATGKTAFRYTNDDTKLNVFPFSVSLMIKSCVTEFAIKHFLVAIFARPIAQSTTPAPASANWLLNQLRPR